jgi:hypothetical protein
MLKEEKRTPADTVIFNIYEDDHRRNLDSWRNIRVRKHPQHIESPLPFVRVDLKSKIMTEHPNPCPTVQSLYDLCDIDKVEKLFKDDFVLNIMIAHRNAKTQNPYKAYDSFMKLSRTHGIETKIENGDMLAEAADQLHWKAALFSSERIVEKIMDFAEKENKNVLFVLSFPAGSVGRYITENKRRDRSFVEFMKRKGLPYVDLMEAHAKDYGKYNCDVKTYLQQYYVGHYNPLGNLFCAFSLKDALIRMLDPKPVSYQPLNGG